MLRLTFSVKDLRNAIKGLKGDVPVVMACEYGDRAGTTQVLQVDQITVVENERFFTTGHSTTGVGIAPLNDDLEDWIEFDCDTGKRDEGFPISQKKVLVIGDIS